MGRAVSGRAVTARGALGVEGCDVCGAPTSRVDSGGIIGANGVGSPSTGATLRSAPRMASAVWNLCAGFLAMAKNPAQRFQTADAMRGALRSVAPVLGEPTPFAPMIPPESTLDVGAPQTSHPSTPSAPRAVTARPLTAQPITARPVTARPSTAQPLHQPPTTPVPPLAPTIPLAGSASHYSQAEASASRIATTQASAGNRSPLYITLSVVIVLLVLTAAGFGAKRWMDARSSESATTTPADNSTPAVQTIPAADPAPTTPNKPIEASSGKRHA